MPDCLHTPAFFAGVHCLPARAPERLLLLRGRQAHHAQQSVLRLRLGTGEKWLLMTHGMVACFGGALDGDSARSRPGPGHINIYTGVLGT